jgi:hypothetical protein
MAHYALIDENNIVTQVIVVSNDDILDDTGNESEEIGLNFLENLFGHRNWKQTSYNNSFRKNYAGIGYRYYQEHDGFAGPQPYPSWTLNVESLIWESPIPRPNEDSFFTWDEDSLQWIKSTH